MKTHKKMNSIVVSLVVMATPNLSSAQNKFLYAPNSTPVPSRVSSCVLSDFENYIVITGMRDGDTYIGRSGPGSTYQYTTAFYPFESYLRPVSPYMVTVDSDAALLCQQIADGDNSNEVLEKLSEKVNEDAFWWEVSPYTDASWDAYSPRNANNSSPDTEAVLKMPEGIAHSGNVFISARVTTFASEDEYNVAQRRISGVGLTDVIERGIAATIFELSGLDTNQATFESKLTSRDIWRSCAFDTGAIWGGLEADAPKDRLPTNGVSSACFDYGENLGAAYSGEIVRANCPAGILYSDRLLDPAYDVAPIYAEGNFYSWRSVYGPFTQLCPATNIRLLNEACVSGSEEACSYLPDE